MKRSISLILSIMILVLAGCGVSSEKSTNKVQDVFNAIMLKNTYWVADVEDLREFLKASKAKDLKTLSIMMKNGQVFKTENETEIYGSLSEKYDDVCFFTFREGEYKDFSGYALKQYVLTYEELEKIYEERKKTAELEKQKRLEDELRKNPFYIEYTTLFGKLHFPEGMEIAIPPNTIVILGDSLGGNMWKTEGVIHALVLPRDNLKNQNVSRIKFSDGVRNGERALIFSLDYQSSVKEFLKSYAP